MRAFVIKTLLFALIVVAGQVAIAQVRPAEIPETILQLQDHLANNTDIIYLGDSTVWYPTGSQTTAEMLQALLPEQTVGEVSHGAYHLDLYLGFAAYINSQPARPETVIIPINMRSFSPGWDQRPTYQFDEEQFVLWAGVPMAQILGTPLDVFGTFDPAISQDEFLNTPVYNGNTQVGLVRDFEPDGATLDNVPANRNQYDVSDLPTGDALTQRLVYYYMYNLDANHPKIQALIQLADVFQQSEMRPIFYITPVNYELGQRYLGDDFTAQWDANTQLIKDVLADKGFEVLDLSYDLAAFAFIDTEHLRDNGKRHVAAQLAEVIAGEPRLTQAEEASPAENPDRDVVTSTPKPATVTSTLMITVPASSSTPEATSTTPEPTATPTRVVPASVYDSDSEPGTIIRADFLETNEAAFIDEMIQWFYYGDNLLPSQYTVDTYRLKYLTTDQRGTLIEAQADIYVPRLEGDLPMYVYAAGTTGIGMGCPPSMEIRVGGNWGSFRAYMHSVATQGFIGVLPESASYYDETLPPDYFIAELQAHLLLDAARAAFNFFEHPRGRVLSPRPQDEVFLGGYSNGGHSAFAAKDFAPQYAPDLDLAGIVGHGPTTNIEILLIENPLFSPYIIHTYNEIYGRNAISPRDVFSETWLSTFREDVTTRCVDEIFSYYSADASLMYNDGFRIALYNRNLGDRFPEFKEVLDANEAGLSTADTDTPILILQGTGDTVVTPPSQDRFVTLLCNRGNRVTYLVYPAVTHPETRQASFVNTLNWMRGIADGGTPESNCADYM